jgi:hypothetical protein
MATSTEKNTGTSGPANPVPNQGDHDRVVMLSLLPDGTPDQHNPEIIGDKDAALAAAKVQFAQQAVSAVDAVERAVPDEDDTPQDPNIEALKAKHDEAAKKAEAAAEKVVNSLTS